MSTAVQTAPACATEGPRPSCITCVLRDVCRRFWLAERTRRELSGLSDIELTDIGLSRGDIPYVAAASCRNRSAASATPSGEDWICP